MSNKYIYESAAAFHHFATFQEYCYPRTTEMSMRQDTPLGPQCLRCRRRRVKCDSAPDTCQRCLRDGYDCPGYEKKTKWKVVTPEAMQQSKRRGRKLSSSRQQGTLSTEASSDTSNATSPSTPNPNGHLDLAMPTSLILSTIEKEILEIQSSIIYYNDTLVPDLAASPIPSETVHIPLDVWLEKSPKFLHHIIVTIVVCHRLACKGAAHGVPTGKGGRDDSESEGQLADTLNRHRGRGLMHLQRVLSDFWHGDGNPAVSEEKRRAKGLVTLVAVVMLLAQEVQMSATSLWSMHLEAARSLVVQLGGIETLWEKAPLHQSLFTLYMMIDMNSPSTSPAWSINETQQRGYLESIEKPEGFERRIIASFQPCPLPVLMAIVRTNVLRAAMHRRSNPYTASALMDSDNEETSVQHTLASLLHFNPAAWARKVCTSYLQLPLPRRNYDAEEAAWTALATAYRSAAVIYLLRSVEQAPISLGAQDLLHDHRTQLSTALDLLCRDLCRSKESALWRFLSWPLFIYTYELVAWTPIYSDTSAPTTTCSPESAAADTILAISGFQSPPKNVTAALQCLQRMARRLGANSLFDGVELLEGVWRRRCEMAALSGGADPDWRWDDGFEGRCVFIV